MEKYNFGIIGCGRIADSHAQALRDTENAALAGVFDINADIARKFAEKYKTKTYQDMQDMLKDENINVITVCTPNGTHYEIGMNVLNSGKHLLMEKPIALSLKEADELINLSKKVNRKFFAVKQVRFNQPLIELKKALEEGSLGKIISSNITVRWTRPQEFFDKSNWKGTKKLDGGSLLNQGIHYIDALQWLLGPVKEVFAFSDTLSHKIETEDIVHAILKFENNSLGVIEFNICTYPHNLECSLTVLGENGSVKIGGKAIDEIELWNVKDVAMPDLSEDYAKNRTIASGSGSCPRHKQVYESVIETLSKNNNIAIDGEEARKSLEIILAIYKSAEEGRLIKI